MTHKKEATMSKLFVANIPFDASEEDLRAHFAQVGKVVKATIVKDKATNNPRGFGFVEMETPAAAVEAIAQLGGVDLFGRALKIEEAKERPRPDYRAPRG